MEHEHEHNCSTHYHAGARCDCQTPSVTLGHTEKPKCEKCGCPGVLNTAKADDGKNSSWTCWNWQCRNTWKTPNVRSQATDAALLRQVACTDGLGLDGSEGNEK